MIERSSGILMPISSLPSPYGIGTFGKAAYDFADFLHAAGQGYWQLLPLGPTSYGDSPYQSFSTFAGNPYFIDLETLIEDELLTKEECDQADFGENEEEIDYEKIYNFHKTNNYFITIVAAQKTNNVPYGVIEQKDGEFLYMKEKPSQTCIINTGLYVVSSGIKRYIKDQESVDFTELIERCKRNGKKIGVYVIREEAYMDMGQIEEMEQMKEKLGYKGE